jgi:hypothetical protein
LKQRNHFSKSATLLDSKKSEYFVLGKWTPNWLYHFPKHRIFKCFMD